MGMKKDIRGVSLKDWRVIAVALAAVILLLAASALGLYLGGFRYLQVNYVFAPENVTDSVTFMGFINEDGSIKKGNITSTGGKKGSVSLQEDGLYKIVYSAGDVYIGEMDGLQRSGKGKMTYAAGDSYEGDFYADRLHGQGTFTYADGDVYTGGFSGGKKSGQGTYTWVYADGQSGAVYTGAFAEDKRNGYGVFTATDGTVYKGNFENDKRHDSCAEVLIPTAAGYDRYFGGYESDVRTGFGYYFYATGDVYVGEFKNNKPHGQGAIYFVNGGNYKGTFKDGNIDKSTAEEIEKDPSLDPDKNPFNPDQSVIPLPSEPDVSILPTPDEQPTVSSEPEVLPTPDESAEPEESTSYPMSETESEAEAEA